jgi:hypothetical protein
MPDEVVKKEGPVPEPSPSTPGDVKEPPKVEEPPKAKEEPKKEVRPEEFVTFIFKTITGVELNDKEDAAAVFVIKGDSSSKSSITLTGNSQVLFNALLSAVANILTRQAGSVEEALQLVRITSQALLHYVDRMLETKIVLARPGEIPDADRKKLIL